MGRADGLLGDQIGKRKESVMPRVIHFEIHTENPERAMQFYKNLFGWQFQKWEGPMDYWVIRSENERSQSCHVSFISRFTRKILNGPCSSTRTSSAGSSRNGKGRWITG